MNFQLIETPRLRLKGLSPADMRYVFGHYSKAEIMHLLGHQTDQAFENERNKNENGYASYNRSFKLFLMEEKTSNTIIGRCGLHNWNEQHKRAEIGYTMEIEAYKQRGFMTEAVAAVIEYGFSALNLHRIEALVGAFNVPSLSIMKRFNFVQEGVLRQHWLVGENFEDSLVFSRLYEEYRLDNQ